MDAAFTVEQDDVADLEVGDDHLRVKMQDGKVIVYVELDSIYKLVVEKERSRRPGARTRAAAGARLPRRAAGVEPLAPRAAHAGTAV